MKSYDFLLCSYLQHPIFPKLLQQLSQKHVKLIITLPKIPMTFSSLGVRIKILTKNPYMISPSPVPEPFTIYLITLQPSQMLSLSAPFFGYLPCLLFQVNNIPLTLQQVTSSPCSEIRSNFPFSQEPSLPTHCNYRSSPAIFDPLPCFTGYLLIACTIAHVPVDCNCG